jgi:peroxiredoxin
VCSLEFPDLETSFWQPYKDRGLVVVGVAQGGLRGGDTDEILREFIAQTGVTFLVARDTDGGYSDFRRAMIEASVSPFPLDVVIDREGRLVSARGEYDPAGLEADILPMLDPE